MLLLRALDAYLVQLAADGRSPLTVAQAQRHVRLLASFLGPVKIRDVSHEDVARFLASDTVRNRADGRQRKPASANSLRSSLRAFMAYAHGSGLASTNAARLVRRARCGPSRPRALTEGEVTKLLAAFTLARTDAERRDAALFTTMLRTGLRVGSAIGLDVRDADLDARVLRLRRLKNGGEDVVYLADDVVAMLRTWIGGRREGPLFPARHGGPLCARMVGRRLEEIAIEAGIERRLHPHMLRHTFGMSVYERTGDVLVTAQALCHRSVASTAVYARPNAAQVRAAVTE
jgi:integrase/recombinase XerC